LSGIGFSLKRRAGASGAPSVAVEGDFGTMAAFAKETILSVQHWTESLSSFTATRDPGFRFQNGQFAMIGLEVEGHSLLRAYSMASANHEDVLELFSIGAQRAADVPPDLAFCPS
jgi:predicted ferric reductase